MLEKDYPYIAKKARCNYDKGKVPKLQEKVEKLAIINNKIGPFLWITCKRDQPNEVNSKK